VKGKRSCVMQGDWRLIDGKELYHMAADPGQRENIIETQPELLANLQREYDAWWSRLEADIAITNHIIIGHPAENPSLLTSHDWHTEADPPWNQGQIRAGKVDNGYWALEVAEAGTYQFRMYRWPPGVSQVYTEVMPAGNPVPGGTPYAEGLGIVPVSTRAKINGEEYEPQLAPNGNAIGFQAELEAGEIELQTWITDAEGVVRGAYYIEVERLE